MNRSYKAKRLLEPLHLRRWAAVFAITTVLIWCSPGFTDDAARLDALFEAWNHANSPGVVVAVARPGQPPLIRAYGSANLEFGAPMGADSNFYLCSVSKQFVAAAIALLAEDGKLGLDDDVRKYVPELPQYAWPITIRHLIHHTSGLRDYLGVMGVSGRSFANFFGPPEMLEIIARQEALNFEPGTEFSYSNSGYFLLAEIVARVSGKSLRAFSQERIFGPLGMTATIWDDDRSEVLPQRVVSYRKSGETWHHYVKNFNSLGDGGVMSTANDLVHWAENLREPRIGEANFAAAIRTRGRLNSGVDIPYAFGIAHEIYRGRPTLEHGGGMLGFRTHVMHFEDDGSTIVILGNADSMDTKKMANDVADVILPGGEPESRPDSAPADKYEKWFGNYVDPKTQLLWIVKKGTENGVEWVVEGRPYALNQVDKGTLASVDSMYPPSQLVFAKSDVTIHREGETPRALVRLDVPSLDAAALAEYAGAYWSDSLAATYSISVEHDSLVIRCKGARELIVRPVGPDRFANRSDVAFTRDANGAISGMTATLANLRNVTFRKQ